MRLLHTADWHLGRTFHGVSLLDAQARWTQWLVALARDSDVDAILVSGDVYDRALPSVDAVRLASEALGELTAVAPVVVIPGNHDSAARLGFGSSLLARAGLHVQADIARVGEAVVLHDGALVAYPIPYLEPDVARPVLDVSDRGHAAVLNAAMARVRADVARRPGTRSVVLAHAFVAGAEASESERDLSVGGTPSVPGGTFAGVDYAALGHMHAPQRAGANGRYAGSPMAFGFSESAQTKSVALVDLAGAEPAVELVACPVPRALVSLRGTLDELLSDPSLESAREAWVEATLLDVIRPAEAMDRLRVRFPHTVALHFRPALERTGVASYADRVRGLDDRALAAAFLEDVRGEGPDAAEQALLDEALSVARVADAAAEVAA